MVPKPLFKVGDLVRVKLGSAYARFGRVKDMRWMKSARKVGAPSGYRPSGAWIYEVGPIDEFVHTNLTGSFNEGQLDELDAITQLGALVRGDRNRLRLPGVRALSDRGARGS